MKQNETFGRYCLLLCIDGAFLCVSLCVKRKIWFLNFFAIAFFFYEEFNGEKKIATTAPNVSFMFIHFLFGFFWFRWGKRLWSKWALHGHFILLVIFSSQFFFWILSFLYCYCNDIFYSLFAVDVSSVFFFFFVRRHRIFFFTIHFFMHVLHFSLSKMFLSLLSLNYGF